MALAIGIVIGAVLMLMLIAATTKNQKDKDE